MTLIVCIFVSGWSPLHAATANGHFFIVDLLLESGANRSIKDKEGRSAWRIALDNEYGDIVARFAQK